jgi:hypothetical protein
MTPTIAVDAADQWLAVIVDFSEGALAVGAVHWKATIRASLANFSDSKSDTPRSSCTITSPSIIADLQRSLAAARTIEG